MSKYEADPDQPGLVQCVWCDAEGPAPARNPWVPVAEAPEEWKDGRQVLVARTHHDGSRTVCEDWFSAEMGWLSGTTHLMLFPDPPKGD